MLELQDFICAYSTSTNANKIVIVNATRFYLRTSANKIIIANATRFYLRKSANKIETKQNP